MRRSIILGSSAAAILGVAYLWPGFGASSTESGYARGAMCIAGHCCCARAPAETVAANGVEGRLTLDPNQFLGPAKQAYQVAEKNPALLTQLHCYCGCDRIYGHQNLLDCYRRDHGSKCEICIAEALMAEQLSEQGSPVDQIPMRSAETTPGKSEKCHRCAGGEYGPRPTRLTHRELQFLMWGKRA